MLTVNRLTLRHSKDDGVVIVTDIFLTEDRSVLFNGTCAVCQQPVSILTSLFDLIKDCPEHQPDPLVVNQQDVKWCRAIHVVPPFTPLLAS